MQQLVEAEQSKKEGFLVSVCLTGDGVAEKEVWDFGMNKLERRVTELLGKSAEMSMSKYFIL